MKRIIITADDYGMCSVVDKAIEEGINNHFITTTNVLVNMETCDNARTLRNRFPEISVGIHWNVTTGKPVSNPAEIPTLVQEDGTFYPIVIFKKRYAQGLISEKDLETELEVQYAIFHELCGDADYWNTHENSSLSTKTFPVFARIAKKHSVLATRTFERVYYDKIGLGFKRTIREFMVKSFFHLWFSHIRKEFKMPQARVVSFDKISKTEGDVLLNALLRDKHDKIEVVFHPAVSGDYPLFGNISTERVKEYEYVTSKAVYQKYIDIGFKFETFADLP